MSFQRLKKAFFSKSVFLANKSVEKKYNYNKKESKKSLKNENGLFFSKKHLLWIADYSEPVHFLA